MGVKLIEIGLEVERKMLKLEPGESKREEEKGEKIGRLGRKRGIVRSNCKAPCPRKVSFCDQSSPAPSPSVFCF